VTSRLPRGYFAKKVYVIICEKCNEDITRPQSGEDVSTLDEVREFVAEHERVWHGAITTPGPA
jgi:hypothetical protein